jgi:hypothetical protein
MKLMKANLLTQVVGSYDQTKTTIQGRVAQKNIGGLDVLGAPLTKFMDFGTDTGGAVPTAGLFASVNGRVLVCGAPTAGNIPVFLYDFNYTTGASTYVGRINVTAPNTAATTHTTR